MRIAAVMALMAFVLCLVVGGLEAHNPFGTTVYRALMALAGTFFIGLVMGWMLKRMLNENLKQEEKKLKNPPGSPVGSDR